MCLFGKRVVSGLRSPALLFRFLVYPSLSPLSRVACSGCFFPRPFPCPINIDVPFLADSHSQGLATIFQELATERHADVSKRELQDYRVSYPGRKRVIQGPSDDPSS